MPQHDPPPAREAPVALPVEDDPTLRAVLAHNLCRTGDEAVRAAAGNVGSPPAGTYEICRHLLALGHRRIAIAGGLPVAHTWEDRVLGYRDAPPDAGPPDAGPPDAGPPDAARIETQIGITAPPAYDMGVRAVELLVARIQQGGSDLPPREVIFPTTLRIGASCGEGRPGGPRPSGARASAVERPGPATIEREDR